MKTIEQLLKDLDLKGGAIVASDTCSPVEITMARACGDMATTQEGYGYVRRPKEWTAAIQDALYLRLYHAAVGTNGEIRDAG